MGNLKQKPVFVVIDTESEELLAYGENEKECLEALSDVLETDAWEPEQTDEVTLRMYKMVKTVEVEWTPKVRAV